MKKLVATAIAAVAMLTLTPHSVEAQQFHHGFAGPGWGGTGFSISVGHGFGPAFGPPIDPRFPSAFGPTFHYSTFDQGFVTPVFHRPIQVNTFYRGSFHPGFHRGIYRESYFYYGRGFRPGCGW